LRAEITRFQAVSTSEAQQLRYNRVPASFFFFLESAGGECDGRRPTLGEKLALPSRAVALLSRRRQRAHAEQEAERAGEIVGDTFERASLPRIPRAQSTSSCAADHGQTMLIGSITEHHSVAVRWC